MKALIITKDAQPDSNDTDTLKSTMACLQGLGIRYDRALAEAMPADSVVNEYAFIVYPTLNAGYLTPINDSGITIPQFGTFSSAGAAGFGASTGVTSSRTGWNGDFFVDIDMVGTSWVCLNGGHYTLGGNGTAIATVSALNPLTGSAQTGAGNVMMWSQPTGGGSKLYCSSCDDGLTTTLPILLQAAYDDGELTTAVPRRLPLFVDCDHINGQYTHQEPAILDTLAAAVPTGGVIWCGIQNSNAAYLANMDADVQTRLQKYEHPNGPFKYCWHDHVVTASGTSTFDGEGYTSDWTKQDIIDQYDGDEALWNAKGLNFHYPAHYNCGSDSWDEAVLELFTPDNSRLADPAETTAQDGKNFVSFRSSWGSNSSRRYGSSTVIYTPNQIAVRQEHRGILIRHCQDGCNNLIMPYNAIEDWRNGFRYILNSLVFSATYYIHDEDLITADQDPGTDQHGIVVLTQLQNISANMKDVVKGFADPVEYVSKRNFQ